MRDCACERVSLSVSLSWNDIAYIYKFVCDRLPNSASSQDLSGKSSFFIKFFAMVTFFSHFFSSPAVPREAFFFH